MTLTTKSRLSKRKLEVREVRKENQKETSKKHDRKCFEFSERSTKDALLKHLRVLEEKVAQLDKEKEESIEVIEKLKAENIKHTEANTCLQEKLTALESETNSNNSKPNVVQTSTGDILMLCNECEYPAENIFDLGEHMFEIHSSRYEGEGELSLFCQICNDRFTTNHELTAHGEKHHGSRSTHIPNEIDFVCNFCEKIFLTKKVLMVHKKKEHVETIAQCWNFSAGNCILEEKDCWFTHNILEKPGQKNLKCNFCDKNFSSLPELLKHRKQEHRLVVPKCRNIVNGPCKYGSDNCWFIHDKHDTYENERIIVENNEVVQKLFEMMEKITERIVKMEENDIK
jgi:hypothetical protein